MTRKNDIITIDSLSPGQSAVVDHVRESPLRGRLCDLGLVPGTPVKCMYRAPLGDPVSYCIRGAVIALRKKDSRFVVVRDKGICND